MADTSTRHRQASPAFPSDSTSGWPAYLCSANNAGCPILSSLFAEGWEATLLIRIAHATRRHGNISSSHSLDPGGKVNACLRKAQMEHNAARLTAPAS